MYPADESFITAQLIKGFRDFMPPSEHAKLQPYEAKAAHLGQDRELEWKRAHKCAQWAVKIAEVPAHNKIAFEIARSREIVKEVEKSIGGELIEVASIPTGTSISAKMDVELTWVFEAVHAAQRVAEKLGWDAVPWQKLIEDVIATK